MVLAKKALDSALPSGDGLFSAQEQAKQAETSSTATASTTNNFLINVCMLAGISHCCPESNLSPGVTLGVTDHT